MRETTEYICSHCGKTHKDLPAIAFITPHYYDILSDNDKTNIATINSDFCLVEHSDQTDFFIRTTLKQKLIDSCDFLEYGIWVSLSEKNYNDYKDNFNNDNHETTYFGFLCSQIPEYEQTLNIETNVITQKGDSRPIVIPHQDQIESKFVFDYYNGITEAEAIRRIRAMPNK